MAKSAWFLAALLVTTGCAVIAPRVEVVTRPVSPSPGDTLRVEVRASKPLHKFKCRFAGKDYPLFPTESGARALIGLHAEWTPGPYDLQILMPWRSKPIKELALQVSTRAYPTENLTMSKAKTELTQDPASETAKQKIAYTFSQVSHDQFWTGLFEKPATGRISTRYGVRRLVNKSDPWPYHKGWDIAGPHGATVTASNGGRVALAEYFPVQGNMIILDHGQGVMTTYLHLSSITVSTGVVVGKSDVIGKIGSEGFSTGPHLHWGFYVSGEPVDPQPWLKEEF